MFLFFCLFSQFFGVCYDVPKKSRAVIAADKLFEQAPGSVQDLQKQARRERRLKDRAEWWNVEQSMLLQRQQQLKQQQ